MTDAELAEIEKACAEADAGPWKVASDEDALSVVCATGIDYEIATVIQRRAGAEANAKLLAKSRTWVPALIAEVRELQQRLAERVLGIQKARAAALEEAAKVAEGGAFLHDDAPDARFGRACAKAIRRLKEGE